MCKWPDVFGLFNMYVVWHVFGCLVCKRFDMFWLFNV